MKKVFTRMTMLLALLAGALTAQAAAVTFDFENNPQGWPVGEGVNFADGNLTAPLTLGDVTLTNVQGDATQPARIMRANDGVSALYVYKNGSLKLAAAEGKALTAVTVTMKSGAFDLTATNGTVADNAWTGNATEVLFTAAATRQMLQIVVTTGEKNADTVEPVAEVFDVEAANIAEFNAVEDGKTVKLALTDARVNGSYNGYYVEDATAATVVKGIVLEPGTALNGYIIGTKGTDNDIDYMSYEPAPYEPQLTAADATTFEATPTTLIGTVTSVAEAGRQANYGRLLTVENVAISGTGRNKTLTDAEGNTLTARDYMGVLPADYAWPEQASRVTGIVIYYMTGWFLMPVSAEAIEAAGQQPLSVTIDFADNNLALPVGTADDTNAGNLGGKTIETDGVAFSFVHAMTMPTRYYVNGARGAQLQVIAGGQMRVTAPEGYAVTAIVSTGNPATNATTGAITYQNRWEVAKGGGTLTAANQQTQTWTGNAESVLLNSAGATYLNSLTVTLAAADGETLLRADEEADVYTEVSGLAAYADVANNELVALTLTDAVVTSTMINGWGYYVQDATAGAHFYCTGLELEVGDVLNGVVYVKKNVQNMGARICMTELTSLDGLTISKDGDITPVTGTVEQVNVAANKCRVVRLTGVAVKGTDETTATITDAEGTTLEISNGKTNYAPYTYQESLAAVDLQKATVVGILFGSNATTNKLYPLSITDESATAIAAMYSEQCTMNSVYDLQGRQLKNSKWSNRQIHKGLYIVNGRKVVVK